MVTDDLRLGDCTLHLLGIPSETVQVTVTDPPYGIDYQSGWRSPLERFSRVANDDKVDLDFLSDLFRVTKTGGALYLFTRWDVMDEWRRGMEAVGFEVKNAIVWDREVHGLGDLNGAYSPRYDIALFAVKGRHELRGKRLPDVLRCSRIDADKLLHPMQKPVELLVKFVQASSDEGDIVFDPFMGSGSTGVAAKGTGRRFLGIELDERWFGVAKSRLESTRMETVVDWV